MEAVAEQKYKTNTQTVRLLSVIEVPAELPMDYTYESKYGSPYVKHTYEARKLRLKFELDGKIKIVHTPSVVISKSSGFIIGENLYTKNGWFTEIEGEVCGHKGADIFDGGKGLNIAIEDTSKIVPTVKSGDEITISYRTNKYGKMIHIKKI